MAEPISLSKHAAEKSARLGSEKRISAAIFDLLATVVRVHRIAEELSGTAGAEEGLVHLSHSVLSVERAARSLSESLFASVAIQTASFDDVVWRDSQ
jgi:hypothetical protein